MPRWTASGVQRVRAGCRAHVVASSASTAPTAGLVRSTTTPAGAWTVTRARWRQPPPRRARETYAATSPYGGGRGVKRGPAGRAGIDPVDAEGPPVVAFDVPGHEVPVLAPVDDPVRFRDAARRRAAVVAGSRSAAARSRGRRRQCRQQVRVDLRAGPAAGTGTVYVRSASTRLRSRDGSTCSSFGQGLGRGLLHARDGALGGRTQPDRDGDRLLVGQQQRRHRAAGTQPVAAGGAARAWTG